ncbi:MAG: peptidyl-prolyl cis-trans isomerase [Planctomycetes bacterium]|nr:peptidyl-prolyl cis-trans isomerase [Planctomycetota bacterium]
MNSNITRAAILLFVPAAFGSILQNPAATQPAKDANPVVVEVAGARVTAADAFDALMFHFRDDGIEILRKLAGDAIVRAEAGRLHVAVRDDEVDPAVRVAVEMLQKRVETEFAGAVALDRFLEDEMLTTRAEYEQSVRAFARQARLAALVIRYDQSLTDRAVARHIVVRDKKKADECIQKLRDGAAFEVLAHDESIASTKTEGGKLPAFDREFESPITAAVFQTPAGVIGGPIEEIRDGQNYYHIFKVLDRIAARTAPFDDLRAEISTKLRANPLSKYEFEAFMRKCAKRYPSKVLSRTLKAAGENPATRPAGR